MDSQIEEIKAKTDLAQLIGQYVKLSPAGRNLKGLCPFHGERTPSFMVSPERGTWRCFGCGEHGDAITFLEKRENISFIEALEQLARKAGVELKRLDKGDYDRQGKQRLFDALNLAAEYYHYLLVHHSLGREAREYLTERGITDKTKKEFTLGFAPDSWHSLTQFLAKKGFNQSELEQAGLISSRNGKQYDMFRRRLMFPVKDSMGRVVGFSGRALGPDDRGPKYLNSSENPIFHKGQLLFGLPQAKEAIRQKDRVVLVEGNIDVLSSHQAGVLEVVAPLGTALTSQQITIMTRITQNIIIAYDGDKAGQSAIRKSIELLRPFSLSLKVVRLPEDQDPDTLARRSPTDWQAAVSSASDVIDYYLDWVTNSFNLKSESGRAQAIQQILPLISATPDKVNQAFITQRAAAALLIDEELLSQALKSPPPLSLEKVGYNNDHKNSTKINKRVQKVSRKSLLSYYILGTILTSANDTLSLPEIEQVIASISAAEFEPEYIPIYIGISDCLVNHHHLDIREIEQRLPKDARELYDLLTLDSGKIDLTDPDTINTESDQVVTDLTYAAFQLHQLSLKEQIAGLSRQLKQAEALNQPALDLKKQLAQKVKELSSIQQKEDVKI